MIVLDSVGMGVGGRTWTGVGSGLTIESVAYDCVGRQLVLLGRGAVVGAYDLVVSGGGSVSVGVGERVVWGVDSMTMEVKRGALLATSGGRRAVYGWDWRRGEAEECGCAGVYLE